MLRRQKAFCRGHAHVLLTSQSIIEARHCLNVAALTSSLTVILENILS